MNTFTTFANEAQEQSRSTSDALKYACQNWAVHLLRAPNPWDDTLNHIFQTFWSRHLLSWLERQWYLKGLRSCLVVLSEGLKLVKPGPIHVQPNTVAINPDPQRSTMQAPAPVSTSEMSTREPSTPTLTPPTELVPHARVAPRPRLIQHTSWRPPSIPPLAPLVPPLKPETVVCHAGTSKKRISDEREINSDSPFGLVTPTPTKRLKTGRMTWEQVVVGSREDAILRWLEGDSTSFDQGE
ncbi:hypothetical protein DFH29DRAFT_878207 [Suillus ampliporus]|nr:hypothetical protein DFH29DRAFT_878207 [Suillus ampliporus]